jgi:hypothetical protein
LVVGCSTKHHRTRPAARPRSSPTRVDARANGPSLKPSDAPAVRTSGAAAPRPRHGDAANRRPPTANAKVGMRAPARTTRDNFTHPRRFWPPRTGDHRNGGLGYAALQIGVGVCSYRPCCGSDASRPGGVLAAPCFTAALCSGAEGRPASGHASRRTHREPAAKPPRTHANPREPRPHPPTEPGRVDRSDSFAAPACLPANVHLVVRDPEPDRFGVCEPLNSYNCTTLCLARARA